MSTDPKIDPKPLPTWLPPLAEQMHAKLREAESIHQQLTMLCRQALLQLLADVVPARRMIAWCAGSSPRSTTVGS